VAPCFRNAAAAATQTPHHRLYLQFFFFAFGCRSFTHCRGGGRLIIHAGESIIIGQSATVTATAASGGCVSSLRKSSQRRFLSPHRDPVRNARELSPPSPPLPRSDIHSYPKAARRQLLCELKEPDMCALVFRVIYQILNISIAS
jgi:hypothetical protein